MPSYSYANHEKVADIVRNGVPGKDYLVVDVRDSDFRGGNITGARNYPSQAFHDTIEDLIAETRDVPKVIFHCALSQERGPKMARVYAEEMERRGAREQVAREKKELETANADATGASSKNEVATDKPAEQEVLVLQGGFTRWQEKYRNEPKLVEKWSASVWGTSYL